MRRVHSPHCALQIFAHLRAVLGTEAAPLGAHAGLHGAQRFGVSMARRHTDIGPHTRQIFLLHTEQIDALTSGHLDRRNLVFVDRIGDTAQLVGCSLTTPHSRDHAEGAVFLDVGVRALVDVARLRVINILFRPGRQQVIVERRAARRTAIRRTPAKRFHHFWHREQLLFANRVTRALMSAVGAGTHWLHRGRSAVIATRCEHQNLFDQPRA